MDWFNERDRIIEGSASTKDKVYIFLTKDGKARAMYTLYGNDKEKILPVTPEQEDPEELKLIAEINYEKYLTNGRQIKIQL